METREGEKEGKHVHFGLPVSEDLSRWGEETEGNVLQSTCWRLQLALRACVRACLDQWINPYTTRVSVGWVYMIGVCVCVCSVCVCV